MYALFCGKYAGDRARVEKGLEALSRLGFEFLRLQSRFRRSGRYERSSSQLLLESMYLDREVMEGYYLDGLFLSYAFWVNHVLMHRYFESRFLPLLAPSARLLEIGTGHGLMALTSLTTLKGASYEGVDVSPWARHYASELLAAHDLETTRFRIRDAYAGEGDASRDGAICCEVLEHVERPQELVRALAAGLRSGGRAFITTVANVAAEDHIFLFPDADSIRRELAEGGLLLDSELVLPVPGFEQSSPLPLNYAAILHRP